MGTAGFRGKIQIDRGATGTFTEVGEVTNGPMNLSAEELDMTQWGDKAFARLPGLIDATIDLEINFDYSVTTHEDMLKGFLQRDVFDLEWAPNDQGSSQTLLVLSLQAQIFEFPIEPPVDDKVTSTINFMVSDGVVPTISNSFT